MHKLTLTALLAAVITTGSATVPEAIENQPSPARTQAVKELATCKEALAQRTKERAEELEKSVSMAERKLAETVKRNIAARAPEHNWLHNMDWTLNNRHYNHLYKDYIKDEVIKDLGITIRLCDEDFKGLESILEKQTDAKWHSRVDWEWRMKQEVDGSIEKNAAMQQWVKRARGE